MQAVVNSDTWSSPYQQLDAGYVHNALGALTTAKQHPSPSISAPPPSFPRREIALRSNRSNATRASCPLPLTWISACDEPPPRTSAQQRGPRLVGRAYRGCVASADLRGRLALSCCPPSIPRPNTNHPFRQNPGAIRNVEQGWGRGLQAFLAGKTSSPRTLLEPAISSPDAAVHCAVDVGPLILRRAKSPSCVSSSTAQERGTRITQSRRMRSRVSLPT